MAYGVTIFTAAIATPATYGQPFTLALLALFAAFAVALAAFAYMQTLRQRRNDCALRLACGS